MIRKTAGIIWGLFFLTASVSLWAEPPEHPLLERTRQERFPRLQYALQRGAQFELSPDGKTFYLLWLPQGSGPASPPPMVATLSGHDGWAVDDFFVWHDLIQKRGYGLLAIQWWLGQGEGVSDYLNPEEMYQIISDAFQKIGVRPGTALLHGFSRGSTNTYAVAALDRSLNENYFALIIANAGKASLDYPPTRAIESGRFGPQPFAGTHWVTFAGALDSNPGRDGIKGMRETGEWIQRLGGTLELAMEDPQGDHGGFHRNPKNADAALDVFEKLRVKN